MLDADPRIPAELLHSFIVQVLKRKGLFAAEAEIVAERMVEADLRGWTTGGTCLLPGCVAAIDAGELDPRARMLVVQETPAIAVLDGGRGIGHVAATKAVRLAIEKAQAVGSGTVVVRNGHPPGALGAYVLLAAQAGMIAFSTINGLAPDSTSAARTPFGEGPVAWAMPVQDGSPIVLQYVGADAGETIGRALTLQSAVWAGLLAGGKLPVRKTRPGFAEPTEQFFQVFDPSQFSGAERFFQEWKVVAGDLERRSDTLDLSPHAAAAERAQQPDVQIRPDQCARLESLAESLRITPPWRV